MAPTVYRKLAQHARELMSNARTEIARLQLLAWVNEFEEQARAAERESEAIPADQSIGAPPAALRDTRGRIIE